MSWQDSAPGFVCCSPQPAAAEQGTGAPFLLALFASSPAVAPTVCTACGWGAEGTTGSAPKTKTKRSHIIPLPAVSVNQAAGDFSDRLNCVEDVLGVSFCSEIGAHLVSLKWSFFMQSNRYSAAVGRSLAARTRVGERGGGGEKGAK